MAASRRTAGSHRPAEKPARLPPLDRRGARSFGPPAGGHVQSDREGRRGWPSAHPSWSRASRAPEGVRRPDSGCSACSLVVRNGTAAAPRRARPLWDARRTDCPGDRGPLRGPRYHPLARPELGSDPVGTSWGRADRHWLPSSRREPPRSTSQNPDPPATGARATGRKLGASPLVTSSVRPAIANVPPDLRTFHRTTVWRASSQAKTLPRKRSGNPLRDSRRPGPLPLRPLLPSPAGCGREPRGTDRDSRSGRRRCGESARRASASLSSPGPKVKSSPRGVEQSRSEGSSHPSRPPPARSRRSARGSLLRPEAGGSSRSFPDRVEDAPIAHGDVKAAVHPQAESARGEVVGAVGGMGSSGPGP